MENSRINIAKEDHRGDAAFSKALHGKSVTAAGGVAAMMSKDRAAKKVALDGYFKHFENKKAEDETNGDRTVRRSTTGQRFVSSF